MSNFDIIIIVLVVLSGVAGFRKGLITGMSRFIGRIAAIAIAFVFHKQFFNLADAIFSVRESVEPIIGNFITQLLESSISSGTYSNTETLLQTGADQLTIVLTNYILSIGSVLILFILASLIIDLIIALVISPLAKNLSFINKGGGFAFGILSSFIVLCLIVGLITPFLTTAGPSVLELNDSILYPWMVQGYELELSVMQGFADGLHNPLDAFPIFNNNALY